MDQSDGVSALRLEVLSCIPEGQPKRPPLLFVHGGFVGAWCWAEHFLPYFADHGYEAHALSLRGHGASPGREMLRWASLGDYVEDVRQVAQQLAEPPVLIGHSMGGMVVQKYLERYPAAGAVLLASVPPHGVLPSSVGLALRDPELFQLLHLFHAGGPRFASLHGAKRILFSADMPLDAVARHVMRLQPESHRVVIDMSWADLRRPVRRPAIPPLVLGGEHDALFPPDEVDRTARAFGTRAAILPALAHVMMLETRWQTAADHILEWLDGWG